MKIDRCPKNSVPRPEFLVFTANDLFHVITSRRPQALNDDVPFLEVYHLAVDRNGRVEAVSDNRWVIFRYCADEGKEMRYAH